MNNIILSLTVGFVSNVLLIGGLAILVIFLYNDIVKTLKSSHAVIYSKMMTLQNSLNLLLKNMDIDEEETTTEEATNNDDDGCEVAFITRLAKYATQRRYHGINREGSSEDRTFTLIEPDKLEQMRGYTFDTIYIEKDSIKQMNLKEFYHILGPMRAARNTKIEFF